MGNANRNIYVIGDLVIDHTIFVTRPSGPHQKIGEEDIYTVVRRMDTAGGAANTARILAVLNDGRTYLWGITGQSNWGSFRSILQGCQLIDGAQTNVRFRGVLDETQAQMNTITRLVMLEGEPPNFNKRVHKVRFDDYRHVHVSEDKRRSILHYLKRASDQYTIDAIIINDLDMHCLTPDLVKDIAKFASNPGDADNPKNPIPLFVDPKREKDKYADIEGTAILPNLEEWHYLVQSEMSIADLRTRIQQAKGLEDMAQASLRHLRNFRFHIIKCDSLGALLFGPHPHKSEKYAVYRLPPHTEQRGQHQLGCGDVMTAVFALEFSGSDQTTLGALKAFQKANAAVACYRDMSWQRMPSSESIEEAQRQPIEPELVAEVSKAMVCVPDKDTIDLTDWETIVPGLVSVYEDFHDKVLALINDLEDRWEVGRLRSVILGAPSGAGKTKIMSQLTGELGKRMGIDVLDFTNDPAKVQWRRLDVFFENLSKDSETGKVLIVIDEAIKGRNSKDIPNMWATYLRDSGVNMLNAAHKSNVRFLFIDADFQQEIRQENIDSQFHKRCNKYYLPGGADRPMDIPYVALSVIFDLKKDSITVVKCEKRFLLAIIDAALSKSDTSLLCDWAGKAYEAALLKYDNSKVLTLCFADLPDEVRLLSNPPASILPGEITFLKS